MDDVVNNAIEQLRRGAPFKYTPLTLLQKFKEYFDWNRNNPLMAAKIVDKGRLVKEPRMRAMSKSAFQVYAGISTKTYLLYESGKGDKSSGQAEDTYKDYPPICDLINMSIYNQKFEGAAADMLNSNLITRDLGLTDKKEIRGFIINGDEPVEFE